jgi:Phosphoesterase family/Carboxypeptidase regulatory-like domain
MVESWSWVGRRSVPFGRSAVVAVAVVFLLTPLSALDAGGAAVQPGGPPPGERGADISPSPDHPGVGPATAFPTPIQHVFLIMMENEGTDQVYGNLTYETNLANAYGWGGDAVSNASGIGYYAICHPSAPNYLGLTSGQSLQCGTDNYHNYSANNLGNLLQTAGDSWIAYAESATTPCQTTSSGAYLVQHNPFVYYGDLGGDAANSTCTTHDVPIANLLSDYPYSTTPPAFTYIAPNDTDDGHSSSAKYGDAWLAKFLPMLLAQGWYSDSVIFIAYDESYGTDPDSGYDGLAGGPVYMVAVSPYSEATGALGYNASHYNTLSTIEWLLDLPGTGTGNDSTAAFPPMKTLFQFPPTAPTTYPVSGAVTNYSGTGVLGATVYANNSTSSNSTVSGPGGAFSIRLPNGSFELTAVAPGYRPASAGENVTGASLTGVDLRLRSLGSPPVYPVVGVVTNLSNDGLDGATVYANNSTSSNSTVTGPGGAFSIRLPNGSFELTALAPGYRPTSAGENVTGASIVGVDLQLRSIGPPPVYPVLGVVTNASGDGLDGATVYANTTASSKSITATSAGSFSFELSNGSYVITASDLGYKPATLNETVAGAGVPGLVLELVSSPRVAPQSFPILFSETGLTVGDLWAITIAGSSVNSTGAAISFAEPNGTYDFTVGPFPAGVVADPSSGTVSVVGAAVSQDVVFSSVTPAGSPSVVEPPAWEYALGALAVAAIVGGIAVVLWRRSRPPDPPRRP